jgi:HEAT repeat protein
VNISKYENAVFVFQLLSLAACILARAFMPLVPGTALVGLVGILWIARYRPGVTTEMRFLGGLLLSFGLLVTIVGFLPAENPVPPSIGILLLGIAILGLGSSALAFCWPWIQMRRAARTATGVRDFVAALQSPDPVVRSEAATWLGRTGAEAAVLPLSAALQDEDAEVSAAALASLERLRAIAVPALRQALDDDNSEARLLATATLGYLARADAVPALIARLRDSSPDVRAAAAWALGRLQARDALPALANMAVTDTARDSGDVPLASLAQEAIAQIHGA